MYSEAVTDSFNPSHTNHISKSVTLKHPIPFSWPLCSPCTQKNPVKRMDEALQTNALKTVWIVEYEVYENVKILMLQNQKQIHYHGCI